MHFAEMNFWKQSLGGGGLVSWKKGGWGWVEGKRTNRQTSWPRESRVPGLERHLTQGLVVAVVVVDDMAGEVVGGGDVEAIMIFWMVLELGGRVMTDVAGNGVFGLVAFQNSRTTVLKTQNWVLEKERGDVDL